MLGEGHNDTVKSWKHAVEVLLGGETFSGMPTWDSVTIESDNGIE